MDMVRKIGWALHRMWCAVFHHNHLDVCMDLRMGIDEKNRRDFVICKKCNHVAGFLVTSLKLILLNNEEGRENVT